MLGIWLAIAFICALAQACSSASHDDDPAPAAQSIKFRNYESAMSRLGDPLSDSWDNFYVVATKWGGDEDPNDPSQHPVIPGYTVNFNSGDWTYEDLGANQYLKYWDLNAGKYLFSAVAPAPNNSADANEAFRNTTVKVEADGEIKINQVMGNVSTGDYTNSSHSPDWMIAQTQRDALPLWDTDLIAPSATLHESSNPLAAFTDDVPLNFHHLMARVDFYAWATSPIILQTFKVTVADGQEIVSYANYSTAAGWTDKAVHSAHNGLEYCNYTFLDGKTLSTDKDTPTLLSSHVQIPQEWADAGRQLTVYFKTTDDKEYSGTITLDKTTNKDNGWKQNYHYRYTIKITTGEGEKPVVLFAVDMETWKWKEGSSQENTQTDW